MSWNHNAFFSVNTMYHFQGTESYMLNLKEGIYWKFKPKAEYSIKIDMPMY